MADGTRGLDFEPELVVDLFAGAGGASDGIADAYRAPDVAVNHNPIAIAVHRANHPNTRHYIADVFEVCPLEATKGRPVGVLWASPDCRHHSRAKGGRPKSQKIRGLAWVTVRWAAVVRPRIIFIENVRELVSWGPLDENDMPIKAEAGRTFRAFVAAMTTGLPQDHPDMPEVMREIGDHVPMRDLVRGLGYTAEFREMVAADYGTPTIRNRLYGVLRCDGRPIRWPAPTFFRDTDSANQRWKWAAECINFSDLGRSIFDRPRALAQSTERRLARGCWRHVLSAAEPFIIPLRGTSAAHVSTHDTSEPLSTVTGQGTHHALVSPVMIQAAHGEGRPDGVQRWGIGSRAVDTPVGTVTASNGHAVAGYEFAPFLTEFANASTERTFDVAEPLRTQTAQVKGGHFAMAVANLMTIGYGERSGQEARAQSVRAPLGTVVAAGKHTLVATHIVKFRGDSLGVAAHEPMPTVTSGGDMVRPAGAAHALGMACAFLEQANGGFYEGNGRSLNTPMSTVLGSGSHQQLVNAYLVRVTPGKRSRRSVSGGAVVERTELPASALDAEQLRKARLCAALLHRHLPDVFPDAVDVILVGGYALVDITLRMLQPDELKRANGFRADYILDRGLFHDPLTGRDEWRPITKTDQVKLIGNSVCRQVAAALVRENARDLIDLYARLAA